MREQGYYYVKDPDLGWIVGYWNGKHWELLSSQNYIREEQIPDTEFLQINETRIKNPDENSLLISLSNEQATYLLETLDNIQDEGPYHEGWKSKSLENLIEYIEAQINPYEK